MKDAQLIRNERGYDVTLPLIQMNTLNINLDHQERFSYKEKVHTIHYQLEGMHQNTTGWVNLPLEDQSTLLQEIEIVAQEICDSADVLVVVGVGGSFLGARAIQDALTPYFESSKDGIEVIYAGQNLSGMYLHQLLNYLADKRVYVNVVSKSGSTMETALAFRVLRQYMEGRYGLEALRRIIVTTDATRGVLKEVADCAGYRQFVIPANIGGRYSVLTPVGLLPVAVAGVDVSQLINGAKDAASTLNNPNFEENTAYHYAVLRHVMYERGYKIELLASFEPSLSKFHDWWKQLFGESEGKQGRGLFPATANFSTDLHAIGQFIQEGSPILIETLLSFKEVEDDSKVPFDERDENQLNYLSNCSFNEINCISKEGAMHAHAEGGVPVIQIELRKLDAYHVGYLIYFFMKACAVSASLLEVNPFDQPGVETYKEKMLDLLKKARVFN